MIVKLLNTMVNFKTFKPITLNIGLKNSGYNPYALNVSMIKYLSWIICVKG
ncbi:hypothetical protein HN451_02525 [archaeon]|nr:hypothetical protein [archaeon]